jgi:dihydroflavonol-4-reductase
VFIHTAGIISIQEEVSSLIKKVNVDGTKNIIAKCLQYGISRLVYVSSVHAIPEKKKGEEISEISDFDSDKVEGAYAKTKAMATKAVLEAGKEGLDVVVVHPSGIIGPYDDGRNHLVQLFQMYMRGKLPAVVTGGYDFVDVRDVADGIISASEKGRSGECYILSNRYFSMKEIGEYMRLALGRKRKLPALPLSFVKGLAYLFDFIGKLVGRRNIFTPYSFATLGTNINFSHYKATTELGYYPRDMKQTVKDTMDYLKGRLK